MKAPYDTFLDIVDNLQAVRGVSIDDHLVHKPKLSDQIKMIKAVGLYRNKTVKISLNAEYDYSVNELAIGNDGMVHITRNSVGIIPAGKMREMMDEIVEIN